MKIVIAIDSFKGSLSSLQAGSAVKNAILRLDNNAEVLIKPLADGGEGTVEALSSGCVTDDAEVCNEHGIDAYFPIVRGVTTLDDALNTDNAYKNLEATAYQVFKLIL